MTTANAKATTAPVKPTNPPKPAAKAGDVPVEDLVDYKLTASDVVVRTKDGVHIPNDPNNPDRVAYEAWGMAGGVAIPADVPPTAAKEEPKAAPKAAAKEHEYK